MGRPLQPLLQRIVQPIARNPITSMQGVGAIAIPSAGTAGQPIGLLLILTKAS